MKNDYYRNEKIRELREAKGLTQEVLADRVKATSVTISRIETGAGCSFENLCRIADALDVHWWQLLRIGESESILQPA